MINNLISNFKLIHQQINNNDFHEEQLVLLNMYLTTILDIINDENILEIKENHLFLIKTTEITYHEQVKIIRANGYNYLSYCIKNDSHYFSEILRILDLALSSRLNRIPSELDKIESLCKKSLDVVLAKNQTA